MSPRHPDTVDAFERREKKRVYKDYSTMAANRPGRGRKPAMTFMKGLFHCLRCHEHKPILGRKKPFQKYICAECYAKLLEAKNAK